MISVRVYPEEVTLLLDKIPREVAAALRAKMESVIDVLTKESFLGAGKFLDPRQMDSGVTVQGSLVIGYVSYEDKTGVYPIAPKNYAFLFSKERNFFARHVYAHPYPRGSNWIESVLRSKTPWIEAELASAAEGAL